jgi:hypothetical protein
MWVPWQFQLFPEIQLASLFIVDWYYNHRISIPAYAIEQQLQRSGVPKNEMSLIFKNDARSLSCHYVALF